MDLAEVAKVTKYSDQCETANVLFQPIGFDLFGGCGNLGNAFLSKLFTRYAAHHTADLELREADHPQRECWTRVSVAPHKAQAQQLCVDFPSESRVTVELPDVAVDEASGAAEPGARARRSKI